MQQSGREDSPELVLLILAEQAIPHAQEKDLRDLHHPRAFADEIGQALPATIGGKEAYSPSYKKADL